MTVPERSLGTLDTATVMIGLVISPRPAPMANNPANMVASLDWEEIPASAKIPVPVNDMPVAIRMPGPVRINSRPASGDRRKKVSDRGSNSIPATSAGVMPQHLQIKRKNKEHCVNPECHKRRIRNGGGKCAVGEELQWQEPSRRRPFDREKCRQTDDADGQRSNDRRRGPTQGTDIWMQAKANEPSVSTARIWPGRSISRP